MPSLRKPPTKVQEAIAVYSDPHTYRNAEALIRLGFRVGPDDPRYGRNLTCFLVDLEARIYTNRQKAERANTDRNLWALKRCLVHNMTGHDLLHPTPPREATVRQWRERLLPGRKVAKKDDTLPDLLQRFSEVVIRQGVERAKDLGQFPANQIRDFTRARAAHTVIADGTYLTPHSNVRLWTAPDGKDRILGSRAKKQNKRAKR